VDAEAVVDAAEDRAKADARKNPWHFAAETLSGMRTAPNYLRPGSTPGATVGDTSLLEYYNKGNFNNIGTNQHSLGLLNMPKQRYY
jgi:hypothetical protein